MRIDPAKPRATGEAIARALAKRDPFWGPQLIVAGAIGLVVARAVNILQ